MTPRLISSVTALIGGWLLAGKLFPTLPLPYTWGFLVDSRLGIPFIIVGFLLSWLAWPNRTKVKIRRRLISWGGVILALLFSLAALTFGFFIFLATGHYFILGRGMWQDDVQGIGKPNASVWHVTPNFNVTYRYDEHGWRDIEDHESPSGEIVIVGCSYPFGWGVENEETWPALVAQSSWRSFRVLNLSSPGWGPWQAEWVLEDFFSAEPVLDYDRSTPPVAVFYSWLDFHLERTSSRDLEGRDPTKVAVELLGNMRQLCERHHATFAVLHFTTSGNPASDPVLEGFKSEGGEVVDLRAWCTRDVLPNDGHPQASWHKGVADGIARHPRILEITSGGRGK